MIRPLYGWKSFWLGVLVLIFMGWAWAVSVGRYSGAQMIAGAMGGISLAQHNSEVAIFYNGGDLGSWRFETFDQAGFSGPADERYWRRITSQKGVLAIYHAHIIGLFLIPWAAFLAWRWRRMKRGISSRDFSQA